MIRFINKGGIDTSDATATASDIIAQKTAYADGVKITGNLPDPETLYSAVSQLPSAANVGKGVIQSVFDISTEASFNFQNPYMTTTEGFTFKTIGGINELPYSNVSIVIVQLNSQDFYAILFESNSMFITPRGGGFPCYYGGRTDLTDSTVKVYHYQNNDWVLDTSKSQTISSNVARKTGSPDWSFGSVFGTAIKFPGKAGYNQLTCAILGISYEVFDYYSGSSFYNKAFDVADATPPDMSDLTLDEVVQRNLYNGLDVYYSDKTSWGKIASSSKNANAVTSDILAGKTAYVDNAKITGTMPNNGALSYTPSSTAQTIPAGYTSGGTVAAITNQAKSVTITQNGTQTITPDTGYDGMSELEVTTNVEVDPSYYFTMSVYENYPARMIKRVPVDLDVGTSLSGVFSSCINLIEIPLLNTSNVTSFQYTFSACSSLTTIPLLDTSSATNISGMFSKCTNLISIPLLNTSNVTAMNNTFEKCTNLTTVPILNTSKVINMMNAFKDCSNLSNDSLNNILAMCANATSYTYTKTLAYIGLSSAQATTCTGLSNYAAFTAAGWTTGY